MSDYYKELCAAGFSKVQALHLTANYQTALVIAATAQKKHDS
jgi:hypothetical protein